MDKFILDTNAILGMPKLIAISKEFGRIFIPEEVLREIGGHKGALSLINRAEAQNHTIIPSKHHEEMDQFNEYRGLSLGDRAIFQSSESFFPIKERGDVYFVSQDRELKRLFGNNHFQVLTIKELEKKLKEFDLAKSLDEQVEKFAEEYENINQKYFLGSALFGFTSAIIFFLFAINIALLQVPIQLYPKVATLAFFVLFPALGFLLFWIRQWYRITYGILECVFGLLLAFYTVWGFPPLEIKLASVLIACLYVIVRGLDNVGKGLKTTIILKPGNIILGNNILASAGWRKLRPFTGLAYETPATCLPTQQV